MRQGLLFQGMGFVVASVVSAATIADLRAVEDQRSVEIVTVGRTSGKPRPTTIWFVHENGVIWVQSGQGGKTSWYRNLEKTPEVTLRFDGLGVKGRAVLIDDAGETGRVHGLFLDKYWTARISSWIGGGFGTGKVVRIEPVTSARGDEPPSRSGVTSDGASPPEPRPE